MADYFGNLLIEPQTLEHQGPYFKAAVQLIRRTQQEHDIQDTIVVLERTGNYHLAPKRAFAKAGFETRILHPFATKQYRMPADPGTKTDGNDLKAQHRAAVAGFGLTELELESPYRELQLRVRHRRNLVERSSSLTCQIREHLHLSMPGYAALFNHLLEIKSALAIARHCVSPSSVLQLGREGLNRLLLGHGIRRQPRTVDKVLAWASQAADDSIQDGPLHHAIWTDLEGLFRHCRQRIGELERQLARDLVRTPYVRLLALPGVNVVLTAELAGEMGPITSYANANAITGRSGLYPSRYQSDQTDQNGPLIRKANRRLRCALMRIAESLACHCAYYRGLAEADRARGIHTKASRVKIANKFTRVALACVAGNQPMKHPAFQSPDSIMEKLRQFHHLHETPMDQVLADLKAAVDQLPYHTQQREAQVVAEVLSRPKSRSGGAIAIGTLFPAVLARLEVKCSKHEEMRIGPELV